MLDPRQQTIEICSRFVVSGSQLARYATPSYAGTSMVGAAGYGGIGVGGVGVGVGYPQMYSPYGQQGVTALDPSNKLVRSYDITFVCALV